LLFNGTQKEWNVLWF